MSSDGSRWRELARDTDRLERLRGVKDVQRRCAQLLQRGQWPRAAELFAPDAEVRWATEQHTGRAQIELWLAGRTACATAPGGLYTEIVDAPVVHLSPHGDEAYGRWSSMVFRGDGAGWAHVEGGVYENRYVRHEGRWVIASLRFALQYEGDDAHGWTNANGAELPLIPTHFGPFDAGAPILRPVGVALGPDPDPTELASRIARLADECEVRNLVHAYGYYLDRRMWADVVDLFAADASVRIDDRTHHGSDGVRRAHDGGATEGLEWGQGAEYPLFDVTVTVAADRTAVVRGIRLGLLADARTNESFWEFGAVTVRAVVGDDGLWRIAELEVDVLLRARHDQGWARGGLRSRRVTPAAEDRPSRAPRPGPDPTAPAVSTSAAFGELARRLRRAAAYDGVENVSSAYGFFLDDFRWSDMAGIFARHGHKQSAFAGYAIGPEAILGTAIACYGPTRPSRAALSFHWRTQPVIHVSDDGRSANLRTRLFQPRTSITPDATPKDFFMGGLHTGMYPNDQAVFEDGTWRLWGLAVDEHYLAMQDWPGGWAGVRPRPEGEQPRPSIVLTAYPPPILLRDIAPREDGFRGGAGRLREWPEILPMWFHYRNPVSGREPERFWPDCVPCQIAPDTRMTAHGYQLPSAGPVRREAEPRRSGVHNLD